jgi:hypothetical protein
MHFRNTCVGNILTIDSQNQEARFDDLCAQTPICSEGWFVRNKFSVISQESYALLKFNGCLHLLSTSWETTVPPNYPVILLTFSPGKNTVLGISYGFTNENPNGIGTIRVDSICYGKTATDPAVITVIWSYLFDSVLYKFTFDKAQLINDTTMTPFTYATPGCKSVSIINRIPANKSKVSPGSVFHPGLTGNCGSSLEKDANVQRLNRSEKSHRNLSKRSNTSTRSEKLCGQGKYCQGRILINSGHFKRF